MDMWDPYIASTVAHVPDGRRKIVFDRFHIMQHMNKAVDQVRKGENREFMEDDIGILKGTKYLWLFAEENVPETMAERFAMLRRLHLDTGRAWAVKEALRELWSYRRKGWAERYWKHWYFWATHSRLEPVKKVARMIRSHLENVLTYFDHRVTNAVSEGLNSKIQTVKKRLRLSQSEPSEDGDFLPLRRAGFVSRSGVRKPLICRGQSLRRAVFYPPETRMNRNSL